ncbi:hypothetical protein ACWOBE_05165 [Hutsoniella sourekii]
MKSIKRILLCAYTFYILYQPDLGFISPLLNASIILICLGLINVVIWNKKMISLMQKNNIFMLSLILIFPLVHIILMNIIRDYPFTLSNFNHNLLFYIHLINYSAVIFWIEKIEGKFTIKKICDHFLLVGLIQTILIYLMVVWSSFKEIAVVLFSQNQEVDPSLSYIFATRVYGISSSYTFMLPFIQALLAFISIYIFSKNNQGKYLFISLFLIISSSLNNRTGLYIYIILTIILFFLQVFSKITYRKVMWSLLMMMILILGTVFINIFFPYRMDWIIEGVSEIFAFLGGDSSGGYITALTQTHLIFPKGWDLLFGTGQIIFADQGRKLFGFSSDIGYVNDLFKGGIIYLISFYIPILMYIIRGFNDKFFAMLCLLFLLGANYKGMVMTASPLIMLLILLIMAENYSYKFSEGKDAN